MSWPENAQSTSAAVAPKGSPTATVRWLLPSLLAFLYVVQCAWFIRTQSLTYKWTCKSCRTLSTSRALRLIRNPLPGGLAP